jgi:hypothetical protein
MRKIFITGCAKTGTTLVRRLFNAFDIKVYNFDEINLMDLVRSDYNVGKRTIASIFSNVLHEYHLNLQKQEIVEHNIDIVNIVRNKEDVLKSDNGYVSEERYNESMRQAKEYSHLIKCTISYEDLIKDPDKVQLEVAEKLNLKIIHLWSDFPKFYDISQENDNNMKNDKIYQLRPIGAKVQ